MWFIILFIFSFVYTTDSQTPVFSSWRLPSLGIVLSLLKQCSSDFFTYYDIHRQSVSKLQNVEQLPPDEIKEVFAKTTIFCPALCL